MTKTINLLTMMACNAKFDISTLNSIMSREYKIRPLETLPRAEPENLIFFHTPTSYNRLYIIGHHDAIEIHFGKIVY